MKRLIIILLINVIFAAHMFAGQRRGMGGGTSDREERSQRNDVSEEYDRARRNYQEDQANLDEESRRLMRERIMALYQPPFHLGIEYGIGLSTTKAPDEYNPLPKLSHQVAFSGTWYYLKNFALYFNFGWNRLSGYSEKSSSSLTGNFHLDYFTVNINQLFYYRQGFFYLGPILAFKTKYSYSPKLGGEQFTDIKSINFGLVFGGGWRINFLYRMRMTVGLEFRYFLLDWASRDFNVFGFYLKFSFMYGIGKFKSQ